MLCLLWCPHGVIHRPGNASKILFGWCLHLQWPKVYKPFAFLCIAFNTIYQYSGKMFLFSLVCLYCSISIWLFLMILKTWGFVRKAPALNIKFVCNKTQKVHWSSVCDVLPLKHFCLICCHGLVLVVVKNLVNAHFPKNVKYLQVNLLIKHTHTQFLTLQRIIFYLQLQCLKWNILLRIFSPNPM